MNNVARIGVERAELYGELGAILALSQGCGKTNRTPEAGVQCSVRGPAATYTEHASIMSALGKQVQIRDLQLPRIDSAASADLR